MVRMRSGRNSRVSESSGRIFREISVFFLNRKNRNNDYNKSKNKKRLKDE